MNLETRKSVGYEYLVMAEAEGTTFPAATFDNDASAWECTLGLLKADVTAYVVERPTIPPSAEAKAHMDHIHAYLRGEIASL